MKRIVLSVVMILTVLALSACGQPAEPTLSVDQIQGTALALAFTQLAMTQAAMPTPTVPPTSTPMPTNTPAPTFTPFPTVPPVTPTAASNACQDVPPAEPKGDLAEARVVNKTKAPITLSLGLYSANKLGECGTYGFSLRPGESTELTILAGCYWGYAWVNGNKPSTSESTNAMCVGANEDIIFYVDAETIGTN